MNLEVCPTRHFAFWMELGQSNFHLRRLSLDLRCEEVVSRVGQVLRWAGAALEHLGLVVRGPSRCMMRVLTWHEDGDFAQYIDLSECGNLRSLTIGSCTRLRIQDFLATVTSPHLHTLNLQIKNGAGFQYRKSCRGIAISTHAWTWCSLFVALILTRRTLW